MAKARRGRAVLAAVLGGLVALIAAVVAWPFVLPTTPAVSASAMKAYAARDRQTYQPPRLPQPVPDAGGVRKEIGEVLEVVSDRADWIGGATVTCDLGALAPEGGRMAWEDVDGSTIGTSAVVDGQMGLSLAGPSDLDGRHSAVVDGRLTFPVTSEEGSVLVFLEGHATGDLAADMGTWLQVHWSGATPGTTVGCDEVRESESATLVVDLRDEEGRPFPTNPHWDEILVVIRGCGLWWFVRGPVDWPHRFSVPAGPCGLQVERRHPNLPLIVARSAVIAVQTRPGEIVELTLSAPPEPPIYQAPDLIELAAVADLTAYEGSGWLADRLEAMLRDISAGTWSPTDDLLEPP
jgi:hypothetical protein